jgi:hypothetical protein
MKKLIIPILLIAVSTNIFAQRGEKIQEIIKAKKIAFITERLDLSVEEAQSFWPVYNEFEAKKEALREESQSIGKDKNLETISDKEAEKIVQSFLAIESKKHKLHTSYINNLLDVLPARKVILLQASEDAFKKRMFEEMKKRRQNFKRDKP